MSCRAVCVAGEEDFGIVAVEAQAAGKPVVAYGRGGALETVDEHLTGVFFREQTVDSLVAAITACERLDTPPEVIAERARRFGSRASDGTWWRRSQLGRSEGLNAIAEKTCIPIAAQPLGGRRRWRKVEAWGARSRRANR